LNNPSRKVEWLVWGGLAAVIVVIAVAFVRSKTKPDELPPLPVIGPVADFALTNQAGQFVTLAAVRGHVWVADIIFTRCAGPCPRMTGQMKSLQAALPPASTAKLITLTTDPEFDLPPVLKKYGDRFGADFNRWTFLTGTKKEIAALAIDSLKLTAVEKKPEERTDADDLFIHSTIFVVVDKQARLRGVFETGGEGVEWEKSKADILATVSQLEREP
jgi:protein SCO1/2